VAPPFWLAEKLMPSWKMLLPNTEFLERKIAAPGLASKKVEARADARASSRTSA